jgi:Zn-dependent protease
MSKFCLDKSITIYTVKKIPVKIHFTYITFVLGVVIFLMLTHGGDSAFKTLQIITYLFIAVIVHELGHAFVAFRLGHKVRDITIYPIGGLATIELTNQKSSDMGWIAFAGPASNFILFALCFPFEAMMLDGLGMLSLILGAGNLLPIRSFDGGVILRSMIIGKLGETKTNQVLFVVSILIIALISLIGLYINSLLLCISALFMLIYGVVLNDNTQQSSF